MDPSEKKLKAEDEARLHSRRQSSTNKHRQGDNRMDTFSERSAELIPDRIGASRPNKDGDKGFARVVPDNVPPTTGYSREYTYSKDSKLDEAELLLSEKLPARKSRSGIDSGDDKPVTSRKGRYMNDLDTEKMSAVAARHPRDPHTKDEYEYTNEKLGNIPAAGSLSYAKQPRDLPPVSYSPVNVEQDSHEGSSVMMQRDAAASPPAASLQGAVNESRATRPRPRITLPEVRPGAVAVAGFDGPNDNDDDTYYIGGDYSVAEEPPPQVLNAHVVEKEGYSDHGDILDQIEELERIDEEVIEAQVTPEVADTSFFAKRSTRVSSACLVLAVIVAVAVGVTVGGRDGPSPPVSPSPSSAPSFSPSLAPTSVEFSGLYDFIANASLDGGAALSDPSSPQYKSARWLSNNTNLDEYSDAQKIQRYILAVLYYSTNGHDWVQKDGWLSDEAECTWFSKSSNVFCQYYLTLDRVVTLDLSQNNLVGTLPALELALLSDTLGALHLNDNVLSGSLPSELGLLTKLSSTFSYGLQLNTNKLGGTIPTEFGKFTSLGFLNVEGNVLSGEIPSELGLLVALTSLQLAKNKLNNTIPSSLYLMTNLADLGVDDNKLTGVIPTNVALLSNLVNLELAINEFRGTIPSELGLLVQLTTLSLNDNTLTSTIPSELMQLTSLVELFLYNNMLSGPYTCPTDIEDCRVSCSPFGDESCRTLP